MSAEQPALLLDDTSASEIRSQGDEVLERWANGKVDRYVQSGGKMALNATLIAIEALRNDPLVKSVSKTRLSSELDSVQVFGVAGSDSILVGLDTTITFAKPTSVTCRFLYELEQRMRAESNELIYVNFWETKTSNRAVKKKLLHYTVTMECARKPHGGEPARKKMKTQEYEK